MSGLPAGMIDGVVSFHMNPQTCGVSKFNHQLAAKLGVPCVSLAAWDDTVIRHPLVSVKASEMGDRWLDMPHGSYTLLLHDRPGHVPLARRVLYADEIGIPSTLTGNPDRQALSVLLFGMAHKRAATVDHLCRLGDLLAGQARPWTVSVSQAIHEGSPWDTIWADTEQQLRDLFGDHLRMLGYLADDALAKELREASACALFFDPAARANNTTLWAALDAGCPLITNLDGQSPPELQHGQTCYDVTQLDTWPSGFPPVGVALAGREVARGRSWDRFLEVLRA